MQQIDDENKLIIMKLTTRCLHKHTKWKWMLAFNYEFMIYNCIDSAIHQLIV